MTYYNRAYPYINDDFEVDLPIFPMFEAIYRFQDYEEFDHVIMILKEKLVKAFDRIKPEKPKGGIYRKIFDNVIYYPNGLCCQDKETNKKIVLPEWEDPDAEKIRAKAAAKASMSTEELAVLDEKKIKRKLARENRKVYSYSLYRDANRTAYRQLMAILGRPFLHRYENVPKIDDMKIYEAVKKYGPIYDLPQEGINAVLEHDYLDSRLVDFTENIFSSLFSIFRYNFRWGDNDPQQNMVLYTEEAINKAATAYRSFITKGGETALDYRTKGSIKTAVGDILHTINAKIPIDVNVKDMFPERIVLRKYEKRPMEDFAGDFGKFCKVLYPKLLELAEKYEHIKIYFEQMGVVPPPSDETVKARKKAARALAKKMKQLEEQEAEQSASQVEISELEAKVEILGDDEFVPEITVIEQQDMVIEAKAEIC